MLEIFLIGVSLSMDAFAISVANGLTLRPFRLRYALWMGLYFGFFQFAMPLLGCLLGSTVSHYVERFGPYISFFLLAFIGGKMLFDALRPNGEEEAGMKTLSHKQLLAEAVATSIDALAVGVSFAFQEDVKLLPSCALIGCTTFAISFFGTLLASRVPGVRGEKAGIIGGVVLIGIGIKLLAEGLL
ncbi:MAG: manganese efflux pump [Oscillospiraceae bacterium]|nr:manganese efflux pump [Oscillospiraceae bacterium]